MTMFWSSWQRRVCTTTLYPDKVTEQPLKLPSRANVYFHSDYISIHRWKVCFNVFNQPSAGLYQMCEKHDPLSQNDTAFGFPARFPDWFWKEAGLNIFCYCLFFFFTVLFWSNWWTACSIGVEKAFFLSDFHVWPSALICLRLFK